MRLTDDYLQLRRAYPDVTDGETFHVSMADLADALYCSQRNAKIILSKMMQCNWVRFLSGKGRGHTSELTFLMNRDELLIKEAADRVQNGEVESAFQLMREFGDSSIVKSQFMDWFSAYFGYQVENHADTYFETLKLPIHRSITTLDPSMTFYAFDSHMIKQIFNTLVEYDYETNQIIGGIAHHWHDNQEKTEWVFYLRKGVYFHHGRELEAKDVVFSLNRLKSTHRQIWLVQDIDRITVVSKYAIKIVLKKPNHLFLLFMSYTPTSIVPFDRYKHIADAEPVLPVGSGPYRVTQRTHGMCVLEAFDRYFEGRPFIDRIEIIIVPESDADFVLESNDSLLLVRTGENTVDSRKDWKEVENFSGTSLMTINLKKQGVLQDRQLRKALFHLINRQQMIEDLGEPRVHPSKGFQFIGRPDDVDKDYDPILGARLLEESSYNGEIIQLYAYQRHARDAYWLQHEYQKHGIQVMVNIVSWSDMSTSETIEQADLILFEAVLSEGLIRQIEYYVSCNSFLRMHLSATLCTFVNQTIENLLKSSNAEYQQQQLQTIEQVLKEEYAFIYLAYMSVGTVSHPSLQNVRIHPRGWVDFKNIWFQNE